MSTPVRGAAAGLPQFTAKRKEAFCLLEAEPPHDNLRPENKSLLELNQAKVFGFFLTALCHNEGQRIASG